MVDIEGLVGELIGLVFVVLALSIPIAYILTRSRRMHRAMELLHTERMAAIERGMEIPAAPLELLGDQILKSKRPRTALLPGLVWLFVGIAIAVSRLSLDGHDAPLMVGLIPAGIGLAYLIYYFVEERKQPTNQVVAPQS
jgi:hypothetical protein